jgi:hypothetical protein
VNKVIINVKGEKSEVEEKNDGKGGEENKRK